MLNLFGAPQPRDLARRLSRHPELASLDRAEALKLIKMCILMERRASQSAIRVFITGYLLLTAIWLTPGLWPRFAGVPFYRPGIVILAVLPFLAQAWALVFIIRFNRRIRRRIDDEVRALLAARTRRLPACPECGYDLRGSPGDICPECGASASLDAPPAT